MYDGMGAVADSVAGSEERSSDHEGSDGCRSPLAKALAKYAFERVDEAEPEVCFLLAVEGFDGVRQIVVADGPVARALRQFWVCRHCRWNLFDDSEAVLDAAEAGHDASLQVINPCVDKSYLMIGEREPLVEIIKGRQTSPDTLARAYDFVTQIGKTPIVVNDSRGFFTSRVFRTFRNEGLGMLAEGLNPAMIENASLQVGMPVGPLAVADEVSMALSLSVTRQTIADLAAEGQPYTPHPADAVVEKMVVELNRPGRAGGGGFYDYPADGKKHLWEGLAGHFPERGTANVSFQDMKDRILYVQALESVRCLEEGVLESTRDANVGSILGIGFPRWTGGVLQYINQVGLEAFIERARELAARYGSRFEPPALLVRMSQEGVTF